MKIKFLYFLIINLFVFNNVMAQWLWEIPYKTGVNLNDIHSVDGVNYWIVGDYGTIMKFDGNDFEYYYFPKTTNLNSIQLYSETSGWIVGDSGTILKYDGSSWQEQASPTSYNLNSIWIINQDSALACGDHGTILQCSNNIWFVMTSPYTILPLLSISAIDNYIQAVGYDYTSGSIELEYINQNWNIYLYGGEFYEVTYQNDLSNGWLGGGNEIPGMEGAIIYHRSVPNGTYELEYNHCGAPPFCYSTITDISMNDDNHGWSTELLGSEYYVNLNDPFLSFRLNKYNGSTWETQFEDTNYVITSIHSPTENELFGVGEAGQMIHFKNNLWDNINPTFPDYLNSVTLLDENNGWAVGENGLIIKLENGEWIEQQKFSEIDLKCITFIDDNHGWCVSGTEDYTPFAAGKIYKYSNGSWLPEAYSDICLNSISMVSADFGIAVGGSESVNGCILKYDGNSWNNITSPTGAQLNSVDMVNSNFGAIVGEGTILMYNGSSFNNVPGSWGNIKSVSFSDPYHGWAVDGVNVYRYLNGDWSIFCNLPGNFFSVYSIDESLAYIAGWGVIYRFNGISWDKQCDENGKSELAPFLIGCYFINDSVGVMVGGMNSETWYGCNFAAIMKTSNGGIYVGIDEPSEEHINSELISLKIYPNPANDILNIQFEETNVDALLNIYDIQGKTMISKQIQQEKTNLDIGNLNPGVYIIRIAYNHNMLTRKLVVY